MMNGPMEVAAAAENMEDVLRFVDGTLEEQGAPAGVISRMDVAVDEIFSNITSYSGAKTVSLTCRVEGNRALLIFRDDGAPYDPTREPEPDVTLPAQERPIGGLGIFMVKKMMDDVRYEYSQGFNVLTLEKGW